MAGKYEFHLKIFDREHILEKVNLDSQNHFLLYQNLKRVPPSEIRIDGF